MISGIASIVIGIMFLFIGLGKARISKNPVENAAFVKKWGTYFIIAGPTIVLGGLAKLAAVF